MAYYSELSPIIDNVIGEKMLRNQNLCKLLYCYPESSEIGNIKYPDLDFSVYSQPDIEDTNKLFMECIYPLPKIPNAETEQKTYLTVVLAGGYEPEINSGYRTVNLLIDIICHLNSWKIREGYRPYLIMNEIDKMLNNKLTDLPIENKPYSTGFQPRDYSNYFYGVQMKYELMINSNIICDPQPQNIGNSLDGNFVPIKNNKEEKIIPSFLPKNLNLNRYANKQD